jgi:PPOX class probable F420-dependent enzyme
MTTPEALWQIVAGARNGILATINADGTPQLSNIYFLADPGTSTVRFSTTSVRRKGANLLRDPRASLHVPGADFFNFAVVSGPVLVHVPDHHDDAAIDVLFEIHSGLGAVSEREGFGEQMLADHRMGVVLHVEHVYGQILERL